jgi:O-6-methylguanine DNA methyltransferase
MVDMGILHTAHFESPIGRLMLATSESGLAWVGLPRANGRGFGGWHKRHAPGDTVREGFEPNRLAIAQLDEFLNGKRTVFDLPLDLRGTDFQQSVYQAVAGIPYGESRSYAQIASEIGRPKAVRAVGAANGENPIPLIIPCHRVIAANGQLQGYAGGLPLKARLLAMESDCTPAAQGQLL